MDVRNKKITVVGLGTSGLDSALLLYDQGAVVSVTDSGDSDVIRKHARLLEERYIDREIGRHTTSFMEDTELVVVSPGVPDSAFPLRFAAEKNIPVVSEMEIGSLFCRGVIVAVTGTNGKSTVVSLLGDMLRNAGIRTIVCGNIGNSLSGEIGNIDEKTVVVLETSSFQLEHIETFKPHISVMLNVTEDHFDRYDDFRGYLAAKKRIFENQGKDDILILNHDDASLKGLARVAGKIRPRVLLFSAREKVDGIYFDGTQAHVAIRDTGGARVPAKLSREIKRAQALTDIPLARLMKAETRLNGAHNRENILVCLLAGSLLGADRESMERGVREFTPLAHRFEKIATIGGVDFIDDSKATNIDSTQRALESLGDRAVLIAGGKDKNLSYEKLIPTCEKSVKKMILIGETKSKMREIFKKSVAVEEKGSLEEAVEAAYKSASSGDRVLLSPMCSSFDMFRDYKERGEVFRQAVIHLQERERVKKRAPRPAR